MINNPATIQAVLRRLDDETRAAVLHREADVAAGLVTSDVDVIIDRSPYDVIRAMTRADDSLRLISFCEYDVGAVSTFWVALPDLSVAQLDMMCDPHGVGKYGLLTDLSLATAVPGVVHHRLGAPAERAYLLSKRVHKGQLDPREMVRQLSPEARSYLGQRRLQELGAPDRMRAGLGRSRLGRGRLGRVLRRLREPVGCRVRFTGPDAARMSATSQERFDGYLPHVAVAGTPTDYLRRSASLAFRPSLLFSHAAPRGTAQITLSASGEPVDVWRCMVDQMSIRATRRIAGLCT